MQIFAWLKQCIILLLITCIIKLDIGASATIDAPGWIQSTDKSDS